MGINVHEGEKILCLLGSALIVFLYLGGATFLISHRICEWFTSSR